MSVIVKGVYKDGWVKLAERPAGVSDETEVQVMFPGAELPGTTERVDASEEERLEASRRLMARLRDGIPFGGIPYSKRDELYDRTYRFDKTRDG